MDADLEKLLRPRCKGCDTYLLEENTTGWCAGLHLAEHRAELRRQAAEAQAPIPAPERFKVPKGLTSSFFCLPYKRLVDCDTCLRRQQASEETSNYEVCTSGRCMQGKQVAQAHSRSLPPRQLVQAEESSSGLICRGCGFHLSLKANQDGYHWRCSPPRVRAGLGPDEVAQPFDPKRLRAEAQQEAETRARLPVKAARRGATVFSTPETRAVGVLPSAIEHHQEREEPAWKRAEARLAQVVPAKVMPTTFKPQTPSRPKPHAVVAYGLVVEPDPTFDVFTGRHVEVALAVEASRSSRLQAAQPTPANEEPMPEETPQKTCTVEGCIEPLRINNLSGHCKKHKYVSRKAKPEATPAVAPTRRPKAAAAAPPVQPELPSMPAPVALPRPAQLPSEYLLECVEYAMGLQARFGQALTGAKPSASSAPPHDPS